MVGEEVWDTPLCLVVGKVFFRRQVFYNIVIGFGNPSQKAVTFWLLISNSILQYSPLSIPASGGGLRKIGNTVPFCLQGRYTFAQ
jgi:hypothetical protein